MHFGNVHLGNMDCGNVHFLWSRRFYQKSVRFNSIDSLKRSEVDLGIHHVRPIQIHLHTENMTFGSWCRARPYLHSDFVFVQSDMQFNIRHERSFMRDSAVYKSSSSFLFSLCSSACWSLLLIYPFGSMVTPPIYPCESVINPTIHVDPRLHHLSIHVDPWLPHLPIHPSFQKGALTNTTWSIHLDPPLCCSVCEYSQNYEHSKSVKSAH